jgi:hypothetical protein
MSNRVPRVPEIPESKKPTWGRFLAPVTLVVLVGVALLVVAIGDTSQVGTAAPQNQTAGAKQPVTSAHPDPPGTIDGSKSPELIPDDDAYRLVLLGFAEPENPTPAQEARMRGKIAPAELDKDDTDALIRILEHFQTQLDGLRVQENAVFAANPIPHPDSVGATKLAEISHERDGVFVEAMSALPARLSAPGAAKLHDFIQKQKHGMKVFPDMPTDSN